MYIDVKENFFKDRIINLYLYWLCARFNDVKTSLGLEFSSSNWFFFKFKYLIIQN